jgi:pimeloyl-ACP methyl ester carboxylesterase
MKRTFSLCFLWALAALGCSSITVSRVSDPELIATWQANALDSSELSSRSLQTLRELALEDVYHRDHAAAMKRLQVLAEKEANSDTLFALAELGYLLGKESESQDCAKSVVFYYLCAGYAYHYVFDVRNGACPSSAGAGSLEVFDPRFRLACDLYNTGLAKCLRTAQKAGRFDPGTLLRLPGPDGQDVLLTVGPQGFDWKPEEFGPIFFCADYAVSGLDNHYRGYGLGVSLIGTLRSVPAAPPHVFYPRQMSFPVTAFLRFEGGLAEVRAHRAGRLELYNPLAIQTVEVAQRQVPLENDLTTPLAYFLSNSDWDCLAYEGFLRADRISRRTGIYVFEPYRPGKIPVLMVHGLLSSPMTWAPLFNDLRADSRLREHFQFWFYLYPSGDPYIETAADLRQSLRELRESIDPGHHDAALDQMVLVGHSMGGLVSKLLTVPSGDDFWRLVSAEPLNQVKATPEAKAELRQMFYFEPLSLVRRVVFLGTPHHGSSLSPSPPARLVERFVALPKRLVSTFRTVARDNPSVWPAARSGDLPTSVDLLDPKSPALELLAGRPRPAGVHYHSVIGVLPHPDLLIETFAPGGNSKQGTDGIVPYASAHLEGVDSELVVPADHSHVHQHPLSVAEVKRILLEHLAAVDTTMVSQKQQ